MIKELRSILIPLLMIVAVLKTNAQTYLTFDDCLEIAFKKNLNLKNAELAENIANYQYKSSKTKILPNITGSLSNNYSWGRGIDPITNNYINQEFKSFSGGLNSSINLFSGFQNINSIKLAKQELASNKATIEKLKNEVTIDIASKFTTILYLKEIIESNEEQIKSTQKQIEINLSRFELGYISESDVFKIKSQFANEQLTLTNNKNQLLMNELDLKQLLNIPFNEEINLVPLPDKLISKRSNHNQDNTIINNAVEQNPGLAISRINENKSKLHLAISKSSLFPSINASFGVNSAYSNNNTLFDFNQQLNNNLSYALSLSLSIPIFNQLQNTFKIKESKLNYAKSKIDTEIEKNRLTKIIIQSINDANASFIKYESSLLALEFSEKSYDADLLKLKLGKISTNEFINTKNIYSNNQAELIRSKYELMFNQSLVKFYLENKFEF